MHGIQNNVTFTRLGLLELCRQTARLMRHTAYVEAATAATGTASPTTIGAAITTPTTAPPAYNSQLMYKTARQK